MKIDVKLTKGILLTLAAFIAAVNIVPLQWAVVITTTLCAGIPYFVKNYWSPSDSTQGELNLKDLASALILAIVAAVGQSISVWIVNGSVDLGELWKIVSAVAGTYLTTTLYQGQLPTKK